MPRNHTPIYVLPSPDRLPPPITLPTPHLSFHSLLLSHFHLPSNSHLPTHFHLPTHSPPIFPPPLLYTSAHSGEVPCVGQRCHNCSSRGAAWPKDHVERAVSLWVQVVNESPHCRQGRTLHAGRGKREVNNRSTIRLTSISTYATTLLPGQ